MTLNVPQNTFRFLLNRIWGSMWKTIKGLSVLPLGNKHINLWYSVNRQLLGKNHESVCDVLGGYSFHTDKSLCSTWKLLWKENNRLIHWDSDSTAQSPPSDLTDHQAGVTVWRLRPPEGATQRPQRPVMGTTTPSRLDYTYTTINMFALMSTLHYFESW